MELRNTARLRQLRSRHPRAPSRNAVAECRPRSVVAKRSRLLRAGEKRQREPVSKTNLELPSGGASADLALALFRVWMLGGPCPRWARIAALPLRSVRDDLGISCAKKTPDRGIDCLNRHDGGPPCVIPGRASKRPPSFHPCGLRLSGDLGRNVSLAHPMAAVQRTGSRFSADRGRRAMGDSSRAKLCSLSKLCSLFRPSSASPR